MARSILVLALCCTFAVPFVWSRRVNHDNKMASADVAQHLQDSIQHSHAVPTIFVNGFNYGTDEEAVKKHFGAVGAIKDLQFQGRGAAVITYKKSGAATRAVNELNETSLEGQSRYVVVKLDDPDRERKGDKSKGKDSDEGKTNRQRRGQYEGNARVSGKGGSQPSGRTIFVNGLEFGTDDAALKNHFGTVGAIEDHHFQSKVSAVITYVKSSSAQRAVTELDGSVMSGQTCYVKVKLDDPDRNGAEQSEPSPPAKGSMKDRKGSGKVAGTGSGRAIFAKGFDWGTDGSALEKHFGNVGTIESCYFLSKSTAVVTFVKAVSAQRAVTELGDTTMIGQRRYVTVQLDNPVHKVQK